MLTFWDRIFCSNHKIKTISDRFHKRLVHKKTITIKNLISPINLDPTWKTYFSVLISQGK